MARAAPLGPPIANPERVSTAPPAYSPLLLSVSALPPTICVQDSALCSAQTGETQVTLTAEAPTAGVATWPSVQVAFVIETAVYDGVYDPNARDPGNLLGGPGDKCAEVTVGVSTACEESNGVPFFVAHAQQIANAIAVANTHSNVSFAMVDYFATLDSHDDGDGSEYHVDIPQFVAASSFGGQVQSTFQASVLSGGYVYGDSDFSDNILHSSMITAMFGTIIGSGLDWSPKTHHVIVWMGDTAPRDPNYVQNYAVSPADYFYGSGGTCEPAYSFGGLTSPECEGWVRSQDGNSTHSIAGLAKSSPTCTDSIGGVCTVDTIDLYSTPTDPYSPGWPCITSYKQEGGCPGGPAVRANVANVLEAGCDMAAATGGSWDGPSFYSCPNGQYGHLQAVFVGPSAGQPNINNPSLFNAFRQVGFGPVVGSQVANGTHQPIFQYIPFGAIQIVPLSKQHISATCLKANGLIFPSCDHTPVVVNRSGLLGLGWNWSTKPGQNQMYLGDVWTVSFLVFAAGPPLATVPVDAGTTPYCKAAGSNAIHGLFTWATYIPATNDTVVVQSFPCALVNVLGLPGVPPPPLVLLPPPPIPPPFAIPVAPPVPVLTAIGISAQVGVATISLQAAMAGLLGAGFLRIATKVRPIANPVLASKRTKVGSMFDREMGSGPHVGHFE
ncbi:MAG: hypothetical protein L3J93_02260 [Thermoplasmata archaeon]|nr:hypothetical protein [Thermoplasmata archaeon]